MNAEWLTYKLWVNSLSKKKGKTGRATEREETSGVFSAGTEMMTEMKALRQNSSIKSTVMLTVQLRKSSHDHLGMSHTSS